MKRRLRFLSATYGGELPPHRGRHVGTLFLVATPIGNLEDMTARAIRVLRESSLIAAEDTRRTGRLLSHFGIDTRMLSYHAHNERSRRERLVSALADGDVALVTDAGTPGISDPGADLVQAAAAAGFAVSPIPGPSALTAAVSASGLIDGPFIVLGFLPRRGADRRRLLAKGSGAGVPIVLFEAPDRLAATLGELVTIWGDRPAAVFRELTKLHEEIARGSLTGLAERYRGQEVRGEVVIAVGTDPAPKEADEGDVDRLLIELRRGGLTASQAAREAAAMTGLSRSDLYERTRQLSRDSLTEG